MADERAYIRRGGVGLALLLTGCSALQLVDLAPKEPPPKQPLPYTVAIEAPTPAPPFASGDDAVHSMPVDLTALRAELIAK